MTKISNMPIYGKTCKKLTQIKMVLSASCYFVIKVVVCEHILKALIV